MSKCAHGYSRTSTRPLARQAAARAAAGGQTESRSEICTRIGQRSLSICLIARLVHSAKTDRAVTSLRHVGPAIARIPGSDSSVVIPASAPGGPTVPIIMGSPPGGAPEHDSLGINSFQAARELDRGTVVLAVMRRPGELARLAARLAEAPIVEEQHVETGLGHGRGGREQARGPGS